MPRSDEINNLYDQSLVKIRFKGPSLNDHGVPIYELGETFIAFQRIIHKCYLLQNNKLEPGARLSPQERAKCALHILDRKKESDGYGLAALITDPIIGGVLGGLAANAITALSRYVYQNVIKGDTESEENRLLRGIRNDVSAITERIGNIGGVEQIEVVPGDGVDAEAVTIDQNTRDYVRGLPYKEIYGNTTSIEGVVTKILPRRMTIDLKIAPAKFVTVILNEQQFDRIRRSNQLHHIVRVIGRPIYQEFRSEDFRRFEATKILITRTEAE